MAENVTVRIDIDEVWPIYSLVEPQGNAGVILDVPEQLYNEYQVAAAEFDRIQRELHRLHEEFKPKQP